MEDRIIEVEWEIRESKEEDVPLPPWWLGFNRAPDIYIEEKI